MREQFPSTKTFCPHCLYVAQTVADYFSYFSEWLERQTISSPEEWIAFKAGLTKHLEMKSRQFYRHAEDILWHQTDRELADLELQNLTSERTRHVASMGLRVKPTIKENKDD